MRIVASRLALWSMLFCAGAGCCSAGVAEAASEVQSGSASAFGGGLVVPEVQPLDEGQQLLAQRAAQRANPEAVAERAASRFRFSGLTAMQARDLASEMFPAVVDRPAGGLPALTGVRRVAGFPSDRTASLILDSGGHALIDSLSPIAVGRSATQRVPINLALVARSGGFEPVTPLVRVRIPRRARDGASLVGSGVSLTPVGPSGVPLGGSEAMLDGAAVLYANTQRDTDTLVKPMALGFEADTLLRSAQSPQALAYRVAMPAGAQLVQSVRGGVARVLDRGKTIASVLVPAAKDAAGTPVPVAMSVAGDVLRLAVKHRSGGYLYPILVDPYLEPEFRGIGGEGETTNWVYRTTSEAIWPEKKTGTHFTAEAVKPFSNKEHAILSFTTQGDSTIWVSVVSATGSLPQGSEADSFFINKKEENETFLPASAKLSGESSNYWQLPDCHQANECPGEKERGTQENTAQFGLWTYEGGTSKPSITWEYGMVSIVQPEGPSVSFSSAGELANGDLNALYSGGGSWIGPHTPGVGFEVNASDPGIGVSHLTVENTGHSWVEAHNYLNTSECGGPECRPKQNPIYGYNSKLPEGEDTLASTVEDDMGLKAESTSTRLLKVDATPPKLTVSGLKGGSEIGEGEYALSAEATDGSGSIKSAGVRSVTLKVDGREVGSSLGSCTPGPCTVKGEWTLNGGEFGAGEHTVTVTATDNAGNVEADSFKIKVHHATPVAVGPGSVNPQSGEFGLEASDVSISAPGGALTVGRSYGSRHLKAGAQGPLGPQWRLNVGGQESITRSETPGTPTVAATLTAATGGQVTFTGKGREFVSPPGDSNLTLFEETNVSGEPTEYVLKNAANGAVTHFAHVGPNIVLWKPTTQEGPVAAETTRYIYQTVEGITEPVYALAPEPAGVTTCLRRLESKEALVAGCRVLAFEYAHETTAKEGEQASDWGAYKGRLKEVLYEAYNAATKEIKAIPVAEYSYDANGRLRAESNPQVSPTLRTTYGYDAEGHVTAVDPAGEEPWLLHYGTSAADVSTGRLLSVIRPAAGTTAEVKAQDEASPPANTKAPTLSSNEPVAGKKISVASEGTWTGALSYSYQWERCTAAACAAIPGAVNQSYYPVLADAGDELVAVVSAENADGAATAKTAATKAVAQGIPSSPAPEPPAVGSSSVWTIDYQVPLSGAELPTMTKAEEENWAQTADEPEEAAAIFPPDEPEGWPAKTYKRATIEYLDKDGRTVNAASPTGGVSTTEYNSYNDVIRTLSPDNRAAAIALAVKEGCSPTHKCTAPAELATQLSSESTYEEKGSEPGTELLGTLGPRHTVELTNGSQVEAREHTVYSYNEGAPATGGPYDLVTKMTQGAVVAGVEEPQSVRTTVTSYSGSGTQAGLGWKLRKPISVTTDPTSADPGGLNLVHTTEYNPNTGEPLETTMPAAIGNDKKVPPTYAAAFGAKGTGAGQLEKPTYDAIDAKGNVWVSEYGSNRISEFSPTGTFLETLGWGVSNGEHKLQACTSSCKEGLAGAEKGELSEPTGIAIANGLIYVVDSGNDRVEVYNEEKNEAVNQWGEAGTTAGKFKTPLAIAVSPAGNVWVGDSLNRRLQEFTAEGKFIEAVGWGVVKNSEAKYQVCSSGCEAGLKGEGEGQFASTWGMAFAGGTLYVTDTGNNRVEEINEKSEPVGHFGAAGTGNGQLESPIGIATSPTTGNLYVVDTGNNRVQVFTPSGEYLTQFASFGTGNGQLDFPEGDAIDSSGEIYVVDDLNHRVERWVPTIAGNEDAYYMKTVYYTARSESEFGKCRNHPEWAGLPCEILHASQPLNNLPILPVTMITSYNVWDEPLTTVEEGATTRTKTDTYDSAGRLKTSAETSAEGAALPEVTYSYTAETGAETGALTRQSTPTTGKTITSVYNTLGQLTSYTDADENTSTYEYDVDGRVHKTNDGKGTQTYTYGKTTGLPEELVDSSHEGMKFTATYDVEGNMLSEGYPNGMTAYYSYNQTGTPTSLVYKKLTDCTEEEKEKCQWFKDAIVPSIHGQWLTQTSSLSKQAYTYDAAGRLTQVQNTPTGKGCTTRVYAYDEDSNRTSLTTREPNLKKECTTSGGTIESHTYDTADRLTDAGIAYNSFGDITTLPEADTEGGALTNTYYVNGQAATQTQAGQTIGYNLDPAGRTRETVATGKRTSDTISHYAGPGDSPAWTTNTSGETTRNIPGINGQLAAIQNNAEAPQLELLDLHGDIVATASISETATEPTTKIDSSEFGVPTTSTPPKYSWLGAIELPTELASGVITMGVRSYVPQLGRFLQPDPIPGGSANAYSYTFQDPVNSTDPSGEYTYVGSYVEGADEKLDNSATEREESRVATEQAERHAAEEASARVAAEIAAFDASYTSYLTTMRAAAGSWARETEEEVGAGGSGGAMAVAARAIGADNEGGYCAAGERPELYEKARHSGFYREALHDCMKYERWEAEYQEHVKPAIEACGIDGCTT
jgi:RHS repeat-associated protein